MKEAFNRGNDDTHLPDVAKVRPSVLAFASVFLFCAAHAFHKCQGMMGGGMHAMHVTSVVLFHTLQFHLCSQSLL
jgi:hypothetical protein